MKNIKIFTLGLLLTLTIIFPINIFAEDVSIHLDIEGPDSTLFSDTLNVSACSPDASTTPPTLNAYCAISQSGLPNIWSSFGDDYFLDSFGGVSNDFANNHYWTWFSNLEFGQTALNKHLLSGGENFLLTITKMPLRIAVSSTTPTVGATTTVSVFEFGFDSSFNAVWSPSASSSVKIGDSIFEANGSGQYDIVPSSADSVSVIGMKAGFLDSSGITINPIALPVIIPEPEPEPEISISINLDIENATTTIFKGSVNVTACPESQGSAMGSTSSPQASTINGFCALEQSGVATDWSWFGEDAFLNSIGGVANDYVNNIYWSWFDDLEFGQTALNKHILSADEDLLLAFNTFPMKIVAETETPTENSTTTIRIYHFGFDSSFNGVWLPAASSTINIAGENFNPDSNGVYEFFVSTSSSITISGSEPGFLNPEAITLHPIQLAPDPLPSVDSGNPGAGSGGGGGGGGGGSGIQNNSIDVGKALQFLIANQKTDGSFGSTGSPQGGSALYTDWAAIAFGGMGESEAKQKIIGYFKSANDNLTSATDYERRAMALMALGINPYNGTSINYIDKILERFDGTQIGDPALVNDDIFAIFPLMKSGYSADDSIIQKTVSFIISKQKSDGSWENSIDLTAAAIQSLIAGQVSPSADYLLKAKAYLANQQKPDGGFGNSFSTSWAIQAIAALDDSTLNWVKINATPDNSLFLIQQLDGGLETISVDNGTRIWVTAYAIPAALGKTWDSILTGFSKPLDSVNITGGIGSSGGSIDLGILATTTLATPTIKIATSTLPEQILIPQNLSGQATTSISTPTKTKAAIAPVKIQTVPKITSSSTNISNLQDSNLNLNTAAVAGSPGGGIIKKILSFFAGIFKRVFSW